MVYLAVLQSLISYIRPNAMLHTFLTDTQVPNKPNIDASGILGHSYIDQTIMYESIFPYGSVLFIFFPLSMRFFDNGQCYQSYE